MFAQDHAAQSAYAGLETREIKTLSDADLEDLRRGAGWGLALSAELNGVPGPAHLLELKDQIGLSTEQVTAIEAIFTSMQAEAVIEAAFRDGGLTPEELRTLIDKSAAARSELRFIHLVCYLETPDFCTQTAEKRHNTWYGVWMARAVTEDGRHAMRLVTSRSVLKTREFKTIVGLVSFLAEMGCTTASIPLKEGGCERHAAPGQLA